MLPTIAIAGVLILFVILFLLARKRAVVPTTAADDLSPEFVAFRDSVITAPAPPPVPIIAPASAPQIPEVMASFETAYAIVRAHEGGYQNNPNDTGNKNSSGQLVGTNWGINARVYEKHIGRPPTQADMIDMPRSVAVAIYKIEFWDKIKGDEIADQQVANIFFDGHVNHGSWGIYLMQSVLGIATDYIVGPQTIAAINRAKPAALFEAYKQKRIWAYHDLVRRRPSDQGFLRGWMIRINSFKYQPSGGGAALATLAVAIAFVTFS